MEKILIITIILFSITAQGYSQSKEKNLEKYWYYRERLKNFVKVSSFYHEQGTNLPAARISESGTDIHWDDGNGTFSHYIGMLATEYKLLKTYNQDYTQTVKDLYYALKTFDRLDAQAEMYYRDPQVNQSSDLNGFFIRSDITPDFISKFANDGYDSYFKQNSVKFGSVFDPDSVYENGNNEMSEDNVWHLLEAYSLIIALVDNEYVDGQLIYFKSEVQADIDRIMNMMQHNNMVHTIAWDIMPPSNIKDDLAYKWYVENPATNNLVPDGDGTDGTMLYMAYAFAKAGNRLTGNSSFLPPNYSELIYKKMLATPLIQTCLSLDVYEAVGVIYTPLPAPFSFVDVELSIKGGGYHEKIYDFVPINRVSTVRSKYTCLHDIVDDDYELRTLCATANLTDEDNKPPYEILIDKQNQNIVAKYEHLPLIWCILNNDYSRITTDHSSFIHELLSKAPKCGPFYFNPDNNGGEWAYHSRLVWPERNLEDVERGQYNGLDYMLLHNLYWLSTLNKNYSDNITYSQSSNSNSIVYADNSITCSSPILLNNNSLELNAANSIYFGPGFKVDITNGNSFFANTNINNLTFKVYSTENYTGCEHLPVRNNSMQE